MAFYYCFLKPHVDVVVFCPAGVSEIFVTTDELHRKAFIGQIASRFSQDFTSYSAGACLTHIELLSATIDQMFFNLH